jgi:dTDP-4-dehydrorhamnose reductase
MRKLLITGGSGMLGSHVAVQAIEQGWEVIATYSTHEVEILGCTLVRADIRSLPEIMRVVEAFKPEVLIHTAANAKPDLCEQHKGEAFASNVLGTQNVIAAAESVSAHLVHISTDLVFDGTRNPYQPAATPSPANYYGMTKLASETAILGSRLTWAIVRTSVIYGPRKFPNLESPSDKLLVALTAGKPFRAYVDQYRPAIPVWNLADALLEIGDRHLTGVFHVVSPELSSRFQFAQRVAQVLGLDASLIEPMYMDTTPTIAHRPKLLALDTISTTQALRTHLLTLEDGIHELCVRMER